MNEEEDPGWPVDARTLWMLLVPGLLQRRIRRQGGLGGLGQVRMAFVAFCNAIWLFGFVLLFTAPLTGGGEAAFVFVAVVALLAVVDYAVVGRLERPLVCDALVASYRTRFFVRIASAEAIALIGFAGSFAFRAAWVYYPCALLTAFGFARAAPTRAALQRDQQQLTGQGCGKSLVAALNTPPYNR
jgi:hypothetical protein